MEVFGLHQGLILTEDDEGDLEIDIHQNTILPVWKWGLM
jgi:hypothetical protein